MTAAEKIREIIAAAGTSGIPKVLQGMSPTRESKVEILIRLAYLEGLQRALDIVEEHEKGDSDNERRPS